VVALAECSITGNIGFRGRVKRGRRLDEALFGEKQSRIIISVSREDLSVLRRVALKWRVPLLRLGTVGGEVFEIENCINLSLVELSRSWRKNQL
ncbi:MAG: phosphoribosylformylglycinamidine synthase II, partial [Dehalococcoidia bacterium]|nr:phosphoribosylformylglycinamidine synthase II [Dehalococcoidia bacterium]